MAPNAAHVGEAHAGVGSQDVAAAPDHTSPAAEDAVLATEHPEVFIRNMWGELESITPPTVSVSASCSARASSRSLERPV